MPTTPVRSDMSRSAVALLCAQLLLSACSAVAQPPTALAPPAWPEPAPAAAFATPARALPSFQAPSATHCARPIQTREQPGRTAGQVAATERERLGSFAGAGRTALASAAAPAAPAAPAGPAGPAAPAAAPAPPASPRAEATMARERADKSGLARPQSAIAADAAVAAANQPAQPLVTAGMVDDNAGFAEYLAFRQRTAVAHRARDVRERYRLDVKDTTGRAVADAEVAVLSAAGPAMWARTDAGGQAWLHPDAFDAGRADRYQVVVRKNGAQAATTLQRGQKSAVEVRLASAVATAPTRLDLVFLVDATGSMGDEIGKLKATLRDIAAEVARLPSRPDLCFGLVAYRDRGDAFLLRSHDFTNDLGAFQGVLNALQAGGGGDYPEAMNEALHETVHRLSWRGDGTTRMVVLLADAPPHLDYGGPQYDDDMVAALGKGIKIFGVGASGLDRQGEFIQRQIAQYTGGRFVFLTYAQAHNPASGAGRETVHDVNNYSVDTLDRLIVRLVGEELAKLGRAG